jgi:NAD(P)H-hydrate epimerase
MSANAQWVFTPDQVRELDRIAIEEQGVPGYELMCRAGQFAFDAIRGRYPVARNWRVYCGSGNNAGDGYVVGRLAIEAGLSVTVVAVSAPEQLSGDAAQAWQDYQAAGGQTEPFASATEGNANAKACDLLIDALLGTGLTRPLDGDYLAAVSAIAAHSVPVAAVDIPSGLNGNTGEVMGACVAANMTITFVGLKQGLFLGAGAECCGDVIYSDLHIGPVDVGRVSPVLRCVGLAQREALLPRRDRDAHKGRFGHVLVVGGNTGMGGAVRLAGEAALRSGAGLVSVATRPENVPAVLAGRPELMCLGVTEAGQLDPLLARATVVAVGPGLGQDDWARELLSRVLSAGVPVVVDADALNLLAASPQRCEHWVLTPHPGEAGRLLGVSSGSIQADRRGMLDELQSRYGGTVLLKGAGTLVSNGESLPWLVRAGNPGMASAGMGDVLTGISAGVLAQCADADPADAIALAAWLHATAGDRAAARGERGLLASDVIAELRSCLN